MTFAEQARLQPLQLDAIDALAERLREVGKVAGMDRLLLRRIQRLRAELRRASRLARDDPGARYQSIARRRARGAAVEIRLMVGLDANTHEMLANYARQISSLSPQG